MAVMTHTQNRQAEANYTQLSVIEQDDFDRLMEEADMAGPADYLPLMKAVAKLVGLPAGDLRKCACSCWCGTVFDANTPDAHVIEYGEGYNLGRVQCPACADEHRETA